MAIHFSADYVVMVTYAAEQVIFQIRDKVQNHHLLTKRFSGK